MDFFTILSESLGYLTDPVFVIIIVFGTCWGIFGGAMPGVSATISVGLVLPFTFIMTPEQAVAMLMSVLVGVNYGNSLPAVILGVPGTPAALLTALEGFQLQRRGEGATALGVTYVASVIGQAVSILVFVALVVPLAGIAYLFLAPELFAMTVLGMTAVVGLSSGSVLKSIAAAALGIALAMVGRDPINFVPRFNFGVPELRGGLDVIVVVIGLLAVSELLRSSRQVYAWPQAVGWLGSRFPSWSTIRPTLPAIGIGTVVGSIVGVLPGASADAAAFLSYQQAKSRSKRPQDFGHGSLEGIAANEAAQNACQAGDLIPTLAVGIPGGATMVLILAALTLHGLIPGPLLLTQTPELLYGTVAGLLLATVVLIAAGWAIAKLAITAATVDRSIVLAVAFALVMVGVFILNHSTFDLGMSLLFGAIGYFMLRYGYSVAAAALGLILGERMEQTLRQGLLLSHNSLVEMLTRPITAGILVLAVIAVGYGMLTEVRLRRTGRLEPGLN